MNTDGSSFLELWHDERLDQLELLGFEIPADDPKAYLVMPDIGIRWRDRSFRASEVEASRRGTETTIKVEAEATWYELGDRRRVGSITLIAQPALEGLAEILSTTGWTVAESSNVTTVGTMEAEDKTVLELVRTWARIVGAEIQWNTSERTVGLVSSRGRELGLAFRYGRNLLDVRRRLTPPSVTVLFPYGADSLSIAGINGGLEYLEDFTYYTAHPTDPITIDEARARFTRSAVWSDSSFLVDTELLAAAQLRLASLAQGRASYECKVVDLTELTTVRETLAAGDYVRVADPDFAENLRVRVVRLRRYPLQPWRNVVELGDSPDPSINDGSASRPSASEEWLQFIGPTTADFLIRNDSTYTTNRIPLRFRPGGRGNFHLDLWATGVGAGTTPVEVIAAVDGVSLHEPVEVAYTDGERVRAFLSWAMEDIEGPHDYRVRVTTVADGGPSETNGVDIGPDDYGEAPFYVMVQGAIRETPTAPNSQTFNYTGAVQTFTVPDNVEQITIEAKGGAGGGAGLATSGIDGYGGQVTATFPVVPGSVLDVYVGGLGRAPDNGGGSATWPNGGRGGNAGSQDSGGSGGGSSDVRPQGSDPSAALIVAPGGGGRGNGQSATHNKIGGAGRFFQGDDGGPSTSGADGDGASQFAGGGTTAGGEAGSFWQGGRGGDGSNFSFTGGGGGGGWYGGGGAGSPTGGGFAPGGGGGGGGSGWVEATGSEILLADASNAAAGRVVISWETPDLG